MINTSKRRVLTGVAGVVAAGGIATGVAVTAGSADAASHASGGSSNSGSTSSKASGAPAAPAPGAPGVGPAGGKYDADGTVTSVSGSAMSVRTAFGTVRNYVLNSSTTVHTDLTKPGTKSSVSAIDVHDHVTVHGTMKSSTLRATGVDIHSAHIGGSVASVSGSTLTVTDADGFTRTIDVSSGATYTLNGKKASSSAVSSGRFVDARGTVDSDGTTLDASNVAVLTKAPAAPKGGPAGAPPAPGAGAPAARSGKSGAPKPPAPHGSASASAGGGSGAPSAPSGAPTAPSSSTSSSASGSSSSNGS